MVGVPSRLCSFCRARAARPMSPRPHHTTSPVSYNTRPRCLRSRPNCLSRSPHACQLARYPQRLAATRVGHTCTSPRAACVPSSVSQRDHACAAQLAAQLAARCAHEGRVTQRKNSIALHWSARAPWAAPHIPTLSRTPPGGRWPALRRPALPPIAPAPQPAPRLTLAGAG